MSDEIEKSEQDDIEEKTHPQVEIESNANNEELNDNEISSDEAGSDVITNKNDGIPSAMDDPDIQASLQQLSLSENADKTTRIHTPDSVKNIVEAAIHAANKAVSLDKMLTLFPEEETVDKNILRQATEQLMQDYQSRGVELVEVSSGFRFQVAQPVAPWVSRLWEEKPHKYSRALLETLALVAYRQPITRGEIEEIRGVSVSSQIMRTLVEREWVRIIGHRDVPGKPAMYATTKQFLDYFGLKRLDELPTLAEIRDLDTINAELDFGENNKLDEPDTGNNDEYSHDNPDATEQLEQEKSTDGEDNNDNVDSDERIDIDVELAALKETYKQIDSIKNQEPVANPETIVAAEHGSNVHGTIEDSPNKDSSNKESPDEHKADKQIPDNPSNDDKNTDLKSEDKS